MKYVFLAIVGFIGFCVIRAALRASKGTKYWNHCQRRFDELVASGYERKQALITISKERHPELADSVHERIVDKCPDVIRLANFIYGTLDFRPVTQSGYGGELSNEKAETLIEFTTVAPNGRVNTNWGAVKEKLKSEPN